MQYDVYRNPVPRARGAYPFVIVLQSDLAETGRDRAVAMVAKRSDMGEVAGKLTPIAALEGEDHVLIIPSLTSLRATDIDRP